LCSPIGRLHDEYCDGTLVKAITAVWILQNLCLVRPSK